MSDSQNVLDYLRENFKRVNDRLDKLAGDMLEVKQRLGFLEEAYGSLSRRVDTLDRRLERIERRLDIVETAP